jgi:hypothetical protein
VEQRKLFFYYVPLVSLSIFVGTLSYVFFLRPPIILVSDIYAYALYGADWERMRLLSVSLKARRPVRIYRLMEETASQTISDNIVKASKEPHSVFFPGRFGDAARIYGDYIRQEGNQKTKTILLQDNSRVQQAPDNIVSAVSGTEIDYYRAGYCAALLSADYLAAAAAAALATGSPAIPQGEIVFIYDTQPAGVCREAFISGTSDAGFTGTTNFAPGRDSLVNDRVSCIVVEGPATGVLSAARQPLIVLTWFYNKNYLQHNIMIHIDDSPYALIPKIIEDPLKDGSVIKIPADFTIIKGNIKKRPLSAALRRAARDRVAGFASKN